MHYDRAVPQASLCPGRERARDVDAIASDLPEGARDAVAPVLARLRAALLRDFPENLFLDLDMSGGALARAHASPEGCAESERLVVELSHDFGSAPIRFRYAHDFLYGFDWCRWVAKEPAARAGVGPFDPPFLRYLRGRAAELRALIARDDVKYGAIPDGTFRNPFTFSREPDDEARLHRALAARGLVPIEAWSVGGAVTWDRPFAELREEVARELGLAARPATGRP